tara:strand:+ start:35065 stop:35526 length:462 start_codon:yes stop_codon:yes gene_type:complete
MKMKFVNIAMVLFVSLFLAGCPNDDDNNNDDTSDPQEVTLIAQSGTWRITYFYDSDQDETGNFSGYSFSFNDDGTLVAVNSNTTVSGTWSVTNSSSSSSSSGPDFNIFFNVGPDDDFEDLNDDWDIISATTNKIELIDISGGNGGTDYLTFER